MSVIFYGVPRKCTGFQSGGLLQRRILLRRACGPAQAALWARLLRRTMNLWEDVALMLIAELVLPPPASAPPQLFPARAGTTS